MDVLQIPAIQLHPSGGPRGPRAPRGSAPARCKRRRALCHASLDAIDDAHDDLEAVLAAQPHNSEALAKMAEIKPRLAQREKETKKRFQKLF